MTSARDQIVATTCELLELQGYHATGLNQIIKESGSPKGSLYYYFPGGKEELTAESIEYVGKIVLERIRTNLALFSDAATAISAFIRNVAENVEASGYRAGGPITTVALETAATSERLREVCFHIYQNWIALFAEKLIANQFTVERSNAMASLIIAALEGGIILSRSGKNITPLRNVANEIGLLIQNTK